MCMGAHRRVGHTGAWGTQARGAHRRVGRTGEASSPLHHVVSMKNGKRHNGHWSTQARGAHRRACLASRSPPRPLFPTIDRLSSRSWGQAPRLHHGVSISPQATSKCRSQYRLNSEVSIGEHGSALAACRREAKTLSHVMVLLEIRSKTIKTMASPLPKG